MDGRMDGWMEGWMEGWMDGWKQEWMNSRHFVDESHQWMEGWMDGWMNTLKYYSAVFICYLVSTNYIELSFT